LVNYRREGEVVVVDKTAGQWTCAMATTRLRFQHAREKRTGARFDRKGRPALFASAARARRQSAHAHLSGETSTSNQDSTER